MKELQLNILSILLISILLPISINAQNYHQWDLPDGAISRIGKGTIQKLTFSHDGKRLIVDTGIGLWNYDVSTGTELDFIAEYSSQILGVSPYSDAYVTLDSSNSLSLRDLVNPNFNVPLIGDSDGIRGVVFSPDRKILAGIFTDKIYLWDTITGKQSTFLEKPNGRFRTIVFNPNGNTIATIGFDSTVRLLDVNTGIETVRLSRYIFGSENIAFTPDSNTLITANRNESVELWDTESGERIQEIDTMSLLSIALSPDGKTLAVGGYDGLHLFDAITGAYIAEFGGHIRGVSKIAFSPDGSIIASSGAEELFVWDTKSRRRLLSIEGHIGVWGMAISPDGNTIATSIREKIYFRDLNSGKIEALIFAGHHSWYTDIAFSPDGTTLACNDSFIILWDLSNYVYQASIYGRSPTQHGFVRTSGYTSLAYSQDGHYLAAGNRYKYIHLFRNGRIYESSFIGHTDEVNSIAFSQDNTILASGSHDKTVRIWDVDTATEIHTCKGHTDNVNSVAITHDGSIIASGSDDTTIILWDVITGLPISTLVGHTHGVQSLAFSHDGKTLVSCAGEEDPTIRLWDIDTGEQKTLKGHRTGPRQLNFSPDGNTFISCNWDGEVLIWDYNAIIGTDSQPVVLSEDANKDGVVDLQDLIYVASQFGISAIDNSADINSDGIVNIEDILLVAAAINNQSNAPLKQTLIHSHLTREEVEEWVNQAMRLYPIKQDYHQGLTYLEQLLAHLTPNQTKLLANYPNPFNPETWIPYQLASDTNAKIDIYSVDGNLIRSLNLGFKPAGVYQNQKQAAYWDGKNQHGEPVASGVYFYSLIAGKFSGTKRMVIQK
ncbi:T9SS type A sorting domain-containing protein [Candidatus Poribacteria bacterium]|nr:T9SS type A sorting domain-containing protein [Candidatus Poribacteria bacterium]